MPAAQAAVPSGMPSPSITEAVPAAQLTLAQLTSKVMAQVGTVLRPDAIEVQIRRPVPRRGGRKRRYPTDGITR